MNARVLVHVQHLLGIGHLMRVATLSRALSGAGLEVVVVSGGEPLPALELGGGTLVQLPTARVADRRFKPLLDEGGRPVSEAWKAARRDRLLAVYERFDPDVVVTELFPFGRRQLRFELLPLLERCREDRTRSGRPRVACSVRDILVASPKPERTAEMLALVRRHYDLVLVHGDPRFLPLDATFPHVEALSGRLAYTGYVLDRVFEDRVCAGDSGEESGPRGSCRPREVVVSSGGGAVGRPLLEAALAARPLTRLSGASWRLLAGANLGESDFRALAAAAPGGVVVERARSDFPRLLGRARLSISQGGYNTVMEVLAARLPAVVVPYAGGLETEQTLRARRLAARGLVEVVEEAELDGGTLAAAIERALARPPSPGLTGIDTSGAATTARLLRGLATTISRGGDTP